MKLMDEVRGVLRRERYGYRTEKQYMQWIRRYIAYHGNRNPREMGTTEVEQFLTHLAVVRKIAASTQNQAFNALLFLYKQVLKINIPEEINSVRAKLPERLPVVLTPQEALTIIDALKGVFHLIVKILYGAGLRGIESVRLRVKDIGFDRNEIMERHRKYVNADREWGWQYVFPALSPSVQY